MPTVPRYSSPQVEASNAPITYRDPSEVSAKAFGVLSGQALENVGKGLEDVGSVVADHVNTVNNENIARQAKDLDNQYSAFVRGVTFGDGTPENPGLMGHQGQDAINAFPEAQKAIEDKRQELLSSASNQKVKDFFDNASSVRSNAAVTQMLQHVSQQRVAANDIASKARIEGATSDAALAWNDPNTLMRSLDVVADEMVGQAKAKGLSEQATTDVVNQAQSKVLEKTIDAATQFDLKSAHGLFTTYENSMDGMTRALVAQKLEAADRQELADKERSEREGEHALSEAQKANQAHLIVSVAQGSFKETDAVDALQKGKIDVSQYENVLSYARQPSNMLGSGAEENKVAIDIYTNNGVTFQDIYNNAKLNDAQKKVLIGELNTTDLRGGILGRDDVKNVVKDIDAAIGGLRGPLAILDDDKSQRVRNGLNEFRSKVMAIPGPDLTADKLDQIKAEVIRRWNPDLFDDPTKQLKSLPIPRTWKGPKLGDKASLTKQYIQALSSLQEGHNNGQIDDATYMQEFPLLGKYKEQIDKMVPPQAQVK